VAIRKRSACSSLAGLARQKHADHPANSASFLSAWPVPTTYFLLYWAHIQRQRDPAAAGTMSATRAPVPIFSVAASIITADEGLLDCGFVRVPGRQLRESIAPAAQLFTGHLHRNTPRLPLKETRPGASPTPPPCASDRIDADDSHR